MRNALVLCLCTIAGFGATVRHAVFSTNVDEKTCTGRNPGSAFKPSERQVFFSFVAQGVARGESLRLDWIDPSNTIAESAAYEDLPASAALCFVTQLPVSGFPASAKAGAWAVRVVGNGRELGRFGFALASDGNQDRVKIGSVTRQPTGLILDGAGFERLSVVHIAEYKKDGGWRYIHSLLPKSATAHRVSVETPALGPGEYLAIVRNSDGFTSQPSRFLVSTGGGYQLPLVPGERWLITQGPYGAFSHWRNSLHAYDIAPRGAKWVAAMRGGVVHAHDVGARQSHTRRTFGNYITIQHHDGEFSHYGHLAAGTFLVKTGDRVEAGQPLAQVGNSGYTLGEGGGYHVHVHVTKFQAASSPSIPFKFMELSELAVTRLEGLEVTSSSTATFRIPSRMEKTAAAAVPGKAFEGSVPVGGRWTDLIRVEAGSKKLAADLSWAGENRELRLAMVSPGGKVFEAQRKFEAENPESGFWRMVVDGMKGGGEVMPFKVSVEVAGEGGGTQSKRPRR